MNISGAAVLNILILEDAAAEVQVIDQFLHQQGLQVRCERAGSPDEAAQALQRQSWDAVLMGFPVPGQPFQQALVTLRTRHPDLPVILLTAGLGEETVADLLREGVWDVVRKDNPLRLVSALERALRETSLRRAGLQAEERLRLQGTALESAANSVAITDRHGVIEWINPAFTRLTGYTWDEAVGRSHGELVRSGAHHDAFYANLWHTILAGQVWHGEIINRRKDGVLFDEELTITPVADAEGVIRHFVAVKQDISARRDAADAMRRDHEQQAALRQLLEQVLGGGELEAVLDRCLIQLLAVSWLSVLPKAGIFLPEADGQTLRLTASHNLSSEIRTFCQRVPFGRCHCGRAAASGEPQYARCVDEQHDVTYPGITDHGHYALPLTARGQMLGVLVLYLPPEFRRDAAKEQFLASVADILAGAISRSGDEAALARNEALTSSVMDSLRSAIAVLDRDGPIIHVHQTWRAFAQQNGADASTCVGVGLNYLDYARTDAGEGIRAVLAGRQPGYLLEYPCHSPDRQRWFAMSVTPLQGGEGGVVVSHLDITQRKQAEIALANQQQMLEALVASRTAALRESEADLAHAQAIARIGSWRLDLQDDLMTWSDETYRIFGVEPETPVNFGHFAGSAHPDDIDLVLSAWSAALVGAPYDIEHRIVVHGQTRWVRERAELRFDGLGRAVTGLGTIQDITELKQAELATRAALEEAQRLARVKSEFLANMSHEIRTPLNAVLGLAQLGVRDNAHRRAQETFRRILDSGQHLLGVVNDVLDYSKIDAGKLVLEHAPFELGEAIDRAVNFTAVRAYAKGLAFRVDEAPDLPVRLEGDGMRLTQILLNLLGNAVKFTDAGGIALAVAREGDTLLFRISDSGIGMSPEQLGRLFTPFEQADASTTRRFGGSGLGLTISARLVWAMGGEIRAESEAGRGARFEVRLPLPHAAPPVPAPECLRIRLAGLEQDESAPLAADLARRGILVEIAPRLEALTTPLPDRVVLADAGQPPPPELAGAASLPGDARLLVLATPGASRHPGWGDDAHYIERPVRVRHLLCLPEAVAQPQGAEVPARLQGWRILAAEDAEVNRIVLEDILAQEGAQVVFAEDGAQAVAALEAAGPEGFDAVLMDIQMPVMDGYEATRRLLALAPALPVIGLSAHALTEERERSLACGMVEHVTKPIDIDALVAALLRHGRRPAPAAETGRQLDANALNARYGGRADFIAKLLGSVCTSHQDTAALLRQAAAAADHETIAFTAHKLKGAAGNLQIPTLLDLAAQTEAAARAGQADAATLARRLADRTEALLRELAAHPYLKEKRP